MTFKFISKRAFVSPALCVVLAASSASIALVACSDDAAPSPAANTAGGAGGTNGEGAGAGGSETAGAAGTPAAGAAGNAGGKSDGPSLGTADCDTCLGTECGEARTACAGDADCVTCVNEGDDAACHASDETHERADAVLSCQGKACKASCFGATGGDACKGKISGDCGTCLEGACSCTPDANEPNDTASTPHSLGTYNDADDDEMSFTDSSVHSMADGDWFSFNVVDGLDGGDPRITVTLDSIPTGSNYDMELFFACGPGGDSSTVDDCTAYTDGAGHNGCASRNSGVTREIATIIAHCSSTDEDGVALVHVIPAAWVNTCNNYSLNVYVH